MRNLDLHREVSQGSFYRAVRAERGVSTSVTSRCVPNQRLHRGIKTVMMYHPSGLLRLGSPTWLPACPGGMSWAGGSETASHKCPAVGQVASVLVRTPTPLSRRSQDDISRGPKWKPQGLLTPRCHCCCPLSVGAGRESSPDVRDRETQSTPDGWGREAAVQRSRRTWVGRFAVRVCIRSRGWSSWSR